MIDDFLVAINIAGEGIIKELYIYEYSSNTYIWQNDWWEGQEFELIAFIPICEISIGHNWIFATVLEIDDD